MKICSFPDCDHKHMAKGLCATHYGQQYAGKPLTPIKSPLREYRRNKCYFDGCDRNSRSAGLCNTHYEQKRRYGILKPITPWYHPNTICKVEFCFNEVVQNNLCNGHDLQNKKNKPFTRLRTDRVGSDWLLNHNRVQKRHNDKRKAILANSFVQDIDRNLVYETSGGVCYLCGIDVDWDDWHLDHIHPLSKGGKHAYHNVAVSCVFCNLKKHDKELIDICHMGQ